MCHDERFIILSVVNITSLVWKKYKKATIGQVVVEWTANESHEKK